MENTDVREASIKDIPIILGLLYELGRPKPQKDSDVDSFRKLVKKHIDDDDKKILLVQLNDTEIIAMVSMIFMQRLNQNSLELYIPELIVREKFQHKGVGKKLINYCISIGKEKKCHRIRLESGNQRNESHQFYKKLGFDQSGLSFTLSLN
ncbi:MAG: GNAT family N-acetyltransferase [Candidatus Nitrosopumilus sp. bin_68KS]